MKKFLNLFLIFAIITSCTMEPKYVQPKAPVPLVKADESKKKISIISWREFFQSPDLQRVIKLALDNNHDLRVANLNIESAEDANRVAFASLIPTVYATGYETRQRAPAGFAAFTPKRQFRANLNVTAYELDFFGRLRSLKKSAFESLLASEEARNVIKISVIANTVNAYLQLLLDREILKIAEENIAAQNELSRFAELRYQNGLYSLSDLQNITALVETSTANYETYKKLVEQDKNALMILTGVFDEKTLPQDATINDIKINESLLDFVPSETLLLRPDVQQAEHNLKSMNANIGAARAAFFPSITLTGVYGYASKDLSTLQDNRTWTFTPQVNLPIFTGGRNLANLDNANVQKKIQIAQYEKAIQTAFREASDQFAERKAVLSQMKSYDKILQARKKSFEFSEAKHTVGIGSAADILNAKIILLTAKQNQLTTKKEYLVNLITLYKVLGGGSEIEEVEEVEKKEKK